MNVNHVIFFLTNLNSVFSGVNMKLQFLMTSLIAIR